MIACGDVRGMARVWDMRSHRDIPLWANHAHGSAINQILFHPEKADTLFACSNDTSCTSLLWDLHEEEKYIGTLSRDRPAVKRLKNDKWAWAGIQCLDYHPGSHMLLCGDAAGNVLFWLDKM
jgi:WD40 repeat protein